MVKNLINLKYKVLLFTFAVIFVVAGVRLYDDYSNHTRILENKITQSKTMFSSLFEDEKSNISSFLKSRASGIAGNKVIANAMKNNDRQTLLEESLYRFDLIKQEQPSVKRFHFHTKDGYSLLRVHQIETYGDNTAQAKPMIREALHTKAPQGGFEFGLHDADFLSYRAVVPAFIQNKIDANQTTSESQFVGLVELQYDFASVFNRITHMMNKINSDANPTTYCVLFKEDFVKNFKEESFTKINNEYYLPNTFVNQKNLLLSSLNASKNGVFTFENKDYIVFEDNSIIKSNNNQNEGKIMVFIDISKDNEIFKHSIIGSIIKPIIVLVCLLFVFNWLFNSFLKASEHIIKRKSTVLNLQQNMIVITNGKQLIDVNTAVLDFFGYEKLEDFLDKHKCICEFFKSRDGQNFVQREQNGKNWVEFVLSDPKHTHRVLIEDKTGSEKVFDIKITIYDHDSKNIEVIAVLNDITEIEKRNEELEQFIDSTIEGILVLENQIIIDANKSAIEIFKFDNKAQMLGKNAMELIALDSIDTVKQKIILDNAEPYEVNILKNNGDIAPALVKGHNIITSGKTIRLSAVVDISKIKMLEEETRQKEKMMFHQSKMAAMGEMIGNIAHQWRQPLSAISVAASGMKMQFEYGMLDEANLTYGIEGIMKHSKFLSQTIDDFRDFFKADKDEKLVNLRDSVHKTINLLEANFKNKEIEIIFTKEENIETLTLENELTQAIMNIINNAKDILLENNHEKRKLILIEIYKDDNFGVIEITDNGGGIPDDIIDRIFEPYFTTKHQSQGTGIGLFMTKEIIARHMNGNIFALNSSYIFEDEKHIGAKFKLQIPIK